MRIGAIALIFHILMALPCPVSADEKLAFEVRGNLKVTSILANGRTFNTGTYGFEVRASNDCWQIKAIYGFNHYQVYDSDGTNTYSYLVDSSAGKFSTLAGQVSRGPYPATATWHVTTPWLAYGSKSYFSNPLTNEVILPAPWLGASHTPAAHIYQARFANLEPRFGIPKSIDFIVDHSLIPSSQTNASLSAWDQPQVFKQSQNPEVLRRSTLDRSVAATYRVLQTTNLNGTEIPLEFDLIVFHPAGKSEVERKPQLKMHGTVFSVAAATLKSYLPETDQDIGVVDFRIQNRAEGLTGIQYTVKKGKWITDENSPYLQQVLRNNTSQQRAALIGHQQYEHIKRYWWIYTLGTLGFIFAGFLLVRERRA